MAKRWRPSRVVPRYYVSQSTGNNANAGTIDSPWQTLAKVEAAKALFSGGAVISLKRGDTWNEIFYIRGQSGTADNPIVYTAYGTGALPTIDAQGMRNQCVYATNLSHVVISNLRAVNSLYPGMYLVGNANNVTFDNCVSEFNGRDGFAIEATVGATDQDAIEFSKCTASKNGRAGFHAFHVSRAGVSGVWYRNCLATYNGQNRASHGFSAYLSNNIHYRGCEASHTNIDPATGLPNAFASEGFGFCYDDESGNGSLSYCYAHDNEGPGIGAGHQANNNLIAYNVVANNGLYGVVVNGTSAGSDDILIYGNTVVGNRDAGVAVWIPSSGVAIKNNIIANNGGFGISFNTGVTGYSVANNLIHGNASGAVNNNVSGVVGTVASAPMLDANFVPVAGSPAINAGLNLGATYRNGLAIGSIWPGAVATVSQSGAWDIGAYVYL